MKRVVLFLLLANSAHASGISQKNTNFSFLYNEHRFAQPENVPWAGSYWPHANDGIAYRHNSAPAPSEKFDTVMKLGSKATDWEKKNHTCSTETGTSRQDCEAWWGHCDAWTSAALHEREPRKSIQFQRTTFDVADQKALLTEMWMENESVTIGTTQKDEPTGEWVLDPQSEIGKRKTEFGFKTYYDAFWDVTPRQFFLAMTNTIGILGQGLAIERFTGSEIWNQPVAGYRVLPLRSKDLLKPVTRENQKLYPVFLRVKLFWASDDVPEERVSKKFDIAKISDEEDVDSFGRRGEADYEGRLLKFKLFLDREVELEDGKLVGDAKIIGSGIWDHQEHPGDYSNLDETHPDMIWMPVKLDPTGDIDYGNPHVTPARVRKILGEN